MANFYSDVMNFMANFYGEIARILSSHPDYLLSGGLALLIMFAFSYGWARISREVAWLKTQDGDLHKARERSRLLMSDRERHLQKSGQKEGLAEGISGEAEEDDAATTFPVKKEKGEDPLLNVVNPEGEVPDCIRAVAEGIRQGGEVPPDSVASSLALRLRSRVSDIQFLCSSLILVGLAGTLIGLTLAVVGLKTPDLSEVMGTSQGVRVEAPAPAMDRERLEDVKRKEVIRHLYQSIGTTLGGMRTAFIASLFAVLTTIFLNLRFAGLRKRQNTFLADMEDFIALQLLPLLKPPVAETSISSLATSFDKSSGLMEVFCQRINDQVLESRANWQMFLEAVRQLDATKLEIAKGIESLSASQKELLGTQQEVSTTVRELGKGLAGLSTLGPQTNELLGRLEILLTTQQDMMGGMDGILESANLMVETNKSFLRNHEDLFDRRLANLLAQTQSQIQGVLKKEETHIKVVEERLDSLARSQSSMAAGLKLRSDDDRSLAESVKEYLHYRRGQQVIFEQEFLSGLESFRQTLATQPAQYENLRRQLNKVVESLKDRETWWQESLAAHKAAFDEAVETKLASIRQLLEELTGAPRRSFSRTVPQYPVQPPAPVFTVAEGPAPAEKATAPPTSWWGRLKRSVRGSREVPGQYHQRHDSGSYDFNGESAERVRSHEKYPNPRKPIWPPRFRAEGETGAKTEGQAPRTENKPEEPGSDT